MRVLSQKSGLIQSFPNGAAYVFQLNGHPIARNDSFTASEDFVMSGNLLSDNGNGEDYDPDVEAIWVTHINGASEFQSNTIALTSGALLVAESEGVFSYDPNGAFERLGETEQATDTFTYSISDGIDSASATVTITVLGAEDPTLAFDDHRSVLEDSGASTLDVLANDSGDSPVTIIDVTQPANGIAVLDADSQDLSYEPDPDYCNSSGVPDELGYMLIGGSTARVQITVDCVNDAPYFEHVGDVGVLEDSEFDSVWAHGISAGPTNESGQSVYFQTTVISNPELFLQPPEIDSAGRLSFVPSPDSTGLSDVEVVAVDSGGTAHGGSNTSAPIPFQIDVYAGADLSISKTSGSFFTLPGGDITYTIEVTNSGPSDVLGARVVDDPPFRLGDIYWFCVAQSGSSCNVSGVGLINEFVSIPEGSGVTFTLNATLLDSVNAAITNVAYVDAPTGVQELAEHNNTDSDTDLVALFADGMESKEP